MIFTLTNDKYVALDIFIDHVPCILVAAAAFLATDVKAFSLPQSVVHQTLVLANHFAVISCFDVTWLRWQVFGKKLGKLALTNKANTG